MDVPKIFQAIMELANQFEGKSRVERLSLFASVKALCDVLRDRVQDVAEDGKPVGDSMLWIKQIENSALCLAEVGWPCGSDYSAFMEIHKNINKLRDIESLPRV